MKLTTPPVPQNGSTALLGNVRSQVKTGADAIHDREQIAVGFRSHERGQASVEMSENDAFVDLLGGKSSAACLVLNHGARHFPSTMPQSASYRVPFKRLSRR